MINLIPNTARRSVIKEYWVRVITVYLWLISLAGILIIVFASPVYVLVTSQVDVYAQSAMEAANRVADYDLSAGALVKANQMAQKINSLGTLTSLTEVSDLLESKATTEVRINSYDISRSEGKLNAVQVTGLAATRQSLADFRDSLLAEEKVDDVILPISNLAKDRDIEFSLSVIFK
jgi:hypothetical protein